MTIITVREKSVYGNTHMYVTDAYFNHLISGLTGRKTVTEQDLQKLSGLGFIIEIWKLDGLVKQIQPTRPQGLNGVSDSK